MELGGFMTSQFAILREGHARLDEGVWAHLKYAEGGVHRAVPPSPNPRDASTRAVGVFVVPEIEDDDEIVIDPNDLRIDVYRSISPGGQSVNTTDSAVRITHFRASVVSMQNEKPCCKQGKRPLRVLARLRCERPARRRPEPGPALVPGAHRGSLRAHPHPLTSRRIASRITVRACCHNLDVKPVGRARCRHFPAGGR